MTYRNITFLVLITFTGACTTALPADDEVVGDDDSTMTETDDDREVNVPDLGVENGDGTDGGDTDGTDYTTDTGTDTDTNYGVCVVEHVLSWEPLARGNGRNLAYANDGDFWIANGDGLNDSDSETGNTELLEIDVTDCDGWSQEVNGSFANTGDVPGPDWAGGLWWICSFDEFDNMGYYGTFYKNGVMVEPVIFGVDVNGDGVYTGAGGDEVGCRFK